MCSAYLDWTWVGITEQLVGQVRVTWSGKLAVEMTAFFSAWPLREDGSSGRQRFNRSALNLFNGTK